MIEKPLESTLLVVLLLICATDVLPRLRKIFRISKGKEFRFSPTISTSQSSQVMNWMELTSTGMMMTPRATVARVHCKMCDKWFDRESWLKNKVCDRPEVCSCPEVQKTMRHATHVINKAKETSHTSVTKTSTTLPSQRDDTKDQLYIDVEPVVVIEVKNIGKRK